VIRSRLDDDSRAASLLARGIVSAVERLVRRQPGLGEAALDAALSTLGDLHLGQGGQNAHGGPAFVVGPLMLEPIGNVPPVETKVRPYAQADEHAMAARFSRAERPTRVSIRSN
jgi:hypothetical protein